MFRATFLDRNAPDSGITIWRRAEGDEPWILAWEIYVYSRAGQPLKAQRALARFRGMLRTLQGDPLQMLVVAYAGLPDKEKLLSCLQTAYRQQTSVLTALKVDPLYDPVRGDPRFQDLVRRVGLSQ